MFVEYASFHFFELAKETRRVMALTFNLASPIYFVMASLSSFGWGRPSFHDYCYFVTIFLTIIFFNQSRRQGLDRENAAANKNVPLQ